MPGNKEVIRPDGPVHRFIYQIEPCDNLWNKKHSGLSAAPAHCSGLCARLFTFAAATASVAPCSLNCGLLVHCWKLKKAEPVAWSEARGCMGDTK